MQTLSTTTDGFQNPVSNVVTILNPTGGTSDPNRKIDHETYSQFLQGDTQILATKVRMLMIETPDPFTAIIAPIQPVNTLNFKLTIYNFSLAELRDLPPETVPHRTTYKKREKQFSINRKGIGIMIEADSLFTLEGQKVLQLQLENIAAGALFSVQMDIIRSLLTCKTLDMIYKEMAFDYKILTFEDILNIEKLNFARVQKDPAGAGHLIESAKKKLKSRNVLGPYGLIITPGSLSYFEGHTNSEVVILEKGKFEGPSGEIIVRNPPSVLRDSVSGVQLFEQSPHIPGLDIENHYVPNSDRVSIGEFNELIWENNCDINDYCTKMRDICIYDENKNIYKDIKFEDCLKNSFIGNDNSDNPTDFSDHIIKCVDDLNINSTTDNKPIFPFISNEPNGNDTYTHFKTDYFGHMLENFLNTKNIEDIAMTILNKLNKSHSEIQNSLTELFSFIEQSYNQIPTDEYMRELLNANLNNQDDEGTYGINNTRLIIREWKPNRYGFLNLPKNAVADCPIPIGIHSGPGLQTLMDELNVENSPWKSSAQRIKCGFDVLMAIYHIIRKVSPSCESIKLENRRSWYINSNGFATFFNDLVIRSEPLFLWMPKPQGKQNIPSPEMTFLPEETESIFKDSDQVVKFIESSLGNKRDPKYTIQYTTADGIKMTIPTKFFSTFLILPDEMKITSLLGQTSLPAFSKIHSVINKTVNTPEINTFKSNFYNYLLSIESNKSSDKQSNKITLRNVILNIASLDEVKMIDTIKKLSDPNNNLKQQGTIHKTVIKPLNVEDRDLLIFNKLNLNRDSSNYEKIPIEEMSKHFQELLFTLNENKNGPQDFDLNNPSAYIENVTDSTIKNKLVNIIKQINRIDINKFPDLKDYSWSTVQTMFVKANEIKDINEFKNLQLDQGQFILSPLSSSHGCLRYISQKKDRSVIKTPIITEDNILIDQTQNRVENMIMNPDNDYYFNDVYNHFVSKNDDIGYFFQGFEDPYEHNKKEPETKQNLGLKNKWDNITETNIILNIIMRSIIITRTTPKQLLEWSKQNVLVPLNFILFRIINYQLGTWIFGQFGKDTAFLALGPSYFMYNANGANKTIVGNFSSYFGTIVEKEDRIEHLMHIIAESYEGGSNTIFIKDISDLTSDERDRPSIVCVAISINDEKHNKLDITGQFRWWHIDKNIYKIKDSDVGWGTSKFYNDYVWQTDDKEIFKKLYLSERTYPAGNEAFLTSLSFFGGQFNYNSTTKSFSDRQPNRGHRGEQGVSRNADDVWNQRKRYFDSGNAIVY
mgnify:FL=1